MSFMREFQPLTDEENRVLEEANEALKQFADIPCTACHYCTPGCPAGIHIPEIFAVMNVYKMYGNLTEARNEYRWRPGGALASACIVCGQCQAACPQHLPVPSALVFQLRKVLSIGAVYVQVGSVMVRPGRPLTASIASPEPPLASNVRVTASGTVRRTVTIAPSKV